MVNPFDAVLDDDGWVCLRGRGWFVLGRSDAPTVATPRREPLHRTCFRWGDLRQAALGLHEGVRSHG